MIKKWRSFSSVFLLFFQSCWNCGRKAHETCSGCNIARYCGPFCQHKDWESHHRVCVPRPQPTATEIRPVNSPPVSSSSSSPSSDVNAPPMDNRPKESSPKPKSSSPKPPSPSKPIQPKEEPKTKTESSKTESQWRKDNWCKDSDVCDGCCTVLHGYH